MSKGEQKIVAWFLPKKALIKFEGEDDSFPLSSKVMEVANFEKYPILKGDAVDVSVENNEVTFLRKVSGGKKSTEIKSESSATTSSNTSSGEVKRLKVVGIFQGESVKFNEKINNKQWCKLSDELKTKDLRSIGLVANNEVDVTISNGIIVAVNLINAVKSESKEFSKSAENAVKRSGSYRDEDSTDRRTASMNAKDVVVAYINSKAGIVDTVEKVETLVERLTQKFYTTTQKLS